MIDDRHAEAHRRREHITAVSALGYGTVVVLNFLVCGLSTTVIHGHRGLVLAVQVGSGALAVIAMTLIAWWATRRYNDNLQRLHEELYR